jgi:tetratricopeptide (TPR) repeat protein
MWLVIGEEDYARAIAVLERLVKIYPGHILGNIWLATSYAGAGNLDKAIEYQESAVQDEKTVNEVSNLADFYMPKGLYQKAEDLCHSFLKDVEDNGWLRGRLAASYLCRRQFNLALAEAEKAYLLDPTLKIYMGAILLCKDDFSGAEKFLSADWQTTLLLARGKINEMVVLAQKKLEKSRGDQESERDAYLGSANALGNAGRYEDAYQALRQYLRLSAECRKSVSGSSMLYLPSRQRGDLSAKGFYQAKMKSFDEARATAEELKSLIEKGINTKELRWYESLLGEIELGKKNYRRAIELFSRACGRLDFESGYEWDVEQALLFDQLARALYEAGDLEKARKTYERITLLTTGRFLAGDIYAKAFYTMGRIAEQQGDKPRAIEDYRKFLDLWKDADPGLSEVEDAKKRLAGLNGGK